MVDRKRHLAKACTYRIFGSAGTAAVTYAFTGHLGASLTVGAADTVIKIALYYVHERIWYRVKWGVHEASGKAEVVVTGAGREVPGGRVERAGAGGRPLDVHAG